MGFGIVGRTAWFPGRGPWPHTFAHTRDASRVSASLWPRPSSDGWLGSASEELGRASGDLTGIIHRDKVVTSWSCQHQLAMGRGAWNTAMCK